MEHRGEAVVCVDVGSTYTKTCLVDLADASVVASASHPTTVATDVMDGYDAALAALARQDARAATAPVLACSSAGGGLRIAVVGNEALVTAEAGRRVALGSGGRVVDVIATASPGYGAERLRALSGAGRPDVVLLTGGTDGGNAEALLRAARDLVAGGWRGPVVVAGDVEAQGEVAAVLTDCPHLLADNVVPRIGVLAPAGARAAIREVFLAHVIGGKGLSRRADFAAMVRGATPDVVLTGVEVLARGLDEGRPGVGDVVVVDVGGATTDVYSVVEPDAEAGPLGREVVATTPTTRTVEGDLGMRWSAPATAAAAGLTDLTAAAARRAADPGWLPVTPTDRADDEALAAAAVRIALRRHAGRSRVVTGPGGPTVERTGIDLRRVRLVVGSGGVLRAAGAAVAEGVVRSALVDPDGSGWQLPERPEVVVDHDYVLAAAGLLAGDHPEVAHRLCRGLVGR